MTKMLHHDLSAHASLCERLFEEGHVAHRIGHQGVVTVFESEVAETGEPFLVMELLEGETALERFTTSMVPGDVLAVLKIADGISGRGRHASRAWQAAIGDCAPGFLS